MSDLVIVALIASTPATIAAIFGWLNGRSSVKAATLAADAKKTIEAVEIKVDGRLDKLTALLLAATADRAYAEGMKDEKESQ